MMARSTLIVLAVIALAVELGSCCSSGGGGGRGGGRGTVIHPRVDNRGPVVYPKVDRGSVGVGVRIPVNDRVDVDVSGGVDIPSGNPRGGVGVNIRFRRRRRSTDSAFLDEETSRRVLFSLFDLNKDGKIDVVDWSTEGGKVVSFSDLILAHDMDGDEKLSFDEFLLVPVLPDLGLDFDLSPDDGAQDTGDVPTPSPALD